MAPTKEIIDLTETTLPPEIIVIDSDEDDEVTFLPVNPPSVPHKEETNKSRKQTKKQSVEGELINISARSSRNHSRERDRYHSRKLHGNIGGFVNGKRAVESEERRESPRDNKRRRNRSRDRHARDRRRPHSSERRTHVDPPTDGSNLFFVDVAPAQLPMSPKPTKGSPGSEEAETITLLLPTHVSVFGSSGGEVPFEIKSPSELNGGEDYIEYLDYDDPKTHGIVRYFDKEEEEVKRLRFICKNCGAESEHKTADCPVQICLTCGARNEHSTRGCPISKTCFNCGMKGHINKTCPSRYSGGASDISHFDNCDRCGSSIHKTNECPTLWRLYDYLTDAERENILRARENRRHLGLGNGGEGYIARDEWCYNCGNQGHWGDNCSDLPHPSHAPREPSAFSAYNTMSGPFFDASSESTASTSRRRDVRDWEQGTALPDAWGLDAPINVGKQGRKKERARMERRAKEQETIDDDGWFGKPDKTRGRKTENLEQRSHGGHGGRGSAPDRKLSFGPSIQDARRSFGPPTQPKSQRSLRDRLDDGFEPPPARSRYPPRANSLLERLSDRVDGPRSNKDQTFLPNDPNNSTGSMHRRDNSRSRKNESQRWHERERDRKRDGFDQRVKPGPLYKGSYTR